MAFCPTVICHRTGANQVQSNQEPLGLDSGYGHLFCDRGQRAGRNQLPEIRTFLLHLCHQLRGLCSSTRCDSQQISGKVLIRYICPSAMLPQPDSNTAVLVSYTFSPILSAVLSKPEILTDHKIWSVISQVMVHRSIHGPIQDKLPETSPGFFAPQDRPSSTLSGPNQTLKAVMTEIMKILDRSHINPSAGIQLQFVHDLVIHPTRENNWLSLTSILPALPSFLTSIQPGPAFLLRLAQTNSRPHHGSWRAYSLAWKNQRSRHFRTTSAYQVVLKPRRVFYSDDLIFNLYSPDFQTQCLDWLIPFIQFVPDSNEFLIPTSMCFKIIWRINSTSYGVAVRIGVANLTLAIWQDLMSQKAQPSNAISGPQNQPPTSPLVSMTAARHRFEQYLCVSLPFLAGLTYLWPRSMGESPAASSTNNERNRLLKASNLALALRELSRTLMQRNRGELNQSTFLIPTFKFLNPFGLRFTSWLLITQNPIKT
ncbi:hypothetical protein VP01_140g5 [Puccinia sorghi]|uniref:Uncharacterized protein n=1 Tax=Puccinia sorghi TaxID=27349 RepID=A0A0L6VLE3_9BASI|nr:hypothetical protein VP01_140g5 [Puccinia sorghi]